MQRGTTLFFTLFFISCGQVNRLPFDSLSDEQPKVVSVTPADGDTAYAGNVVEVTFDKPIDPKTITTKSFLITAVEEVSSDAALLWDKAKDGDITSVAGKYETSADQTIVRFIADAPFPPIVRCGILVTPEVLSVDRLPLNQTPGEGPTPFLSTFYTVGTGTSGNSDLTGQTPGAAQLARPTFLWLNEVFYDAAGSDTNGDLFIELFGEPQTNISGYQILIVRGDDGVIVDSLRIPDRMQTNEEGFFVIADAITNQAGQTHVQNAAWVSNFDPPNGPDCIQLVDPGESLVDVLGYGSPLVLRAENNLLCYQGVPAEDVSSGSSLSRNNSQQWVRSTPSPGSHLEEDTNEE